MLDGRDRLARLRSCIHGRRDANQLLAGLRVLAFGETGELLRAHGSRQAELLGQLAMPFALNGVALLPIVLLGGGELFGVIGLRLAWRRAVSRYSAWRLLIRA